MKQFIMNTILFLSMLFFIGCSKDDDMNSTTNPVENSNSCEDIFEPNGSPEMANTTAFPEILKDKSYKKSIIGKISKASDTDCYKINLTQLGTVDVLVEGLDTFPTGLNEAFQVIPSIRYKTAEMASTVSFKCVLTTAVATEYALSKRIVPSFNEFVPSQAVICIQPQRTVSDCTRPYKLTFSYTPNNSPSIHLGNCNSIVDKLYEPNNNMEGANAPYSFSFGNTHTEGVVTGYITSPDDVDYYRVNVGVSRKMYFRLEGYGDIRYQILDDKGKVLHDLPHDNSNIRYITLLKGAYFLKAFSPSRAFQCSKNYYVVIRS